MSPQLIFQSLINGLIEGAILVLIVLGLTLILSVAKLVNLAHGAFVTLGGFTAYFLFKNFSLNPFYSIFVVIPVFFLVGNFIDAISIRHIRQSVTSVMILTLCIAIFLEEMVRLMSGSTYFIIPYYVFTIPYYMKPIHLQGISIAPLKLFVGIIAMAFFISLYIFIKHSKTGKALSVVAQDPELAESIGINTEKLYALSYGIGASLAVAAGSSLLIVRSLSPHMGWLYLIVSLIVVVAGGLGSIKGSVVISFLWTITVSLASVLIGSGWSYIMALIAILIVLLIKPSGLFGREVWRA